MRLFHWPSIHQGASGKWSALCTVTLEVPRASDSLWYFSHLPAREFSITSGVRPFSMIEFPIWCPLLPCLIAPLLWLRRRRLQKQPAGFAVITDSHE
jgi:hypothetical protein